MLTRFSTAFLAIGTGLAASACVSIQAIEPVLTPPSQYLSDVSVDVEFLLPGQVGLRCADRGATFMGLPAINSAACADTTLVTMLDPCMTLTAGAYAQGLCAARSSLARYAEQSSNPVLQRAAFTNSNDQLVGNSGSRAHVVRVEFLNADRLASSCRQQNVPLSGEEGSQYCVGGGVITLGNPCLSLRPGWYERTLCHELAHVNGWPADHAEGAFSRALPAASKSPEAISIASRSRVEPTRY